jgi:hypothetical protein
MLSFGCGWWWWGVPLRNSQHFHILCLFLQKSFKPLPPVLQITAVNGCSARSLIQKAFYNGKVIRKRKPVKFGIFVFSGFKLKKKNQNHLNALAIVEMQIKVSWLPYFSKPNWHFKGHIPLQARHSRHALSCWFKC